MGGGEENFRSACVTGLVVSSADRAQPLLQVWFLCREIRCVIASRASHQPVSARRLQRVWVLEPMTAATSPIKMKHFPAFDKNFVEKWSFILHFFPPAALFLRIIGFITYYSCSFYFKLFNLKGATHCSP